MSSDALWYRLQCEEHGYPVGRNDLPPILLGHFEDLHQAGELGPALLDTWTNCEYPGRVASREDWCELFRLADLAHEPVVGPLWRASADVYADNLSWTTDRDKAEWFHERNLYRSAPGLHSRFGIWRVDCPDDGRVLATLGAGYRDEREVVYNVELSEMERER